MNQGNGNRPTIQQTPQCGHRSRLAAAMKVGRLPTGEVEAGRSLRGDRGTREWVLGPGAVAQRQPLSHIAQRGVCVPACDR